MYNVIEIAKFVISYCMEMGTPVSNLQLQKILYYLQVHFLRKGYALFSADFYAWQHGPVVPEVYYMFSGYGASAIQNIYSTELDQKLKDTLIKITEKLRLLDPWTLVRMTHKENQPWDRVFNGKIDPTGLMDKNLIAMDKTDLGV